MADFPVFLSGCDTGLLGLGLLHGFSGSNQLGIILDLFHGRLELLAFSVGEIRQILLGMSSVIGDGTAGRGWVGRTALGHERHHAEERNHQEGGDLWCFHHWGKHRPISKVAKYFNARA